MTLSCATISTTANSTTAPLIWLKTRPVTVPVFALVSAKATTSWGRAPPFWMLASVAGSATYAVPAVARTLTSKKDSKLLLPPSGTTGG